MRLTVPASETRMTSKSLSTKGGAMVIMRLFRNGWLPLVRKVEQASLAGNRRLADAEMFGRLRLASVSLEGFTHDPCFDLPQHLPQVRSPRGRRAVRQRGLGDLQRQVRHVHPSAAAR